MYVMFQLVFYYHRKLLGSLDFLETLKWPDKNPVIFLIPHPN